MHVAHAAYASWQVRRAECAMDAAPEPIALLLLLPAHTSVPPRPPPLPYVECCLLITLQLRERLSSLLRVTTMLWPPCCREPLPARK